MFYKGRGVVVIAWVKLKRYEFTCSEDKLEYYFDSVGVRGVIGKYVRFDQMDNDVYNLAFGHMNIVTGEVDHSVVSNNGDRQVIMATVAATVLEFSRAHPNKFVRAKGFSLARTRLYQMAIASHFAEISLLFHVLGYIDGRWEQFRLNVNYIELAVKKINIKP